MIELKQGNIFDSEAEVLLNPVNTEGVMGKGLAYQFKLKYPENFKLYYNKCKNLELEIGKELVYVFENGKYVVNFPTKKTWREDSKLEYIKMGLDKLKEFILKNNIRSVAIPPLGAGNGKLDWSVVKNEIIKFCDTFDRDKFNFIIYEPTLSELKLSKAHLITLKFILRSYEQKIDKKEITDLIFQKLVYLYDNKNYFKFEREKKGPFSKLINILYGDLKKYCKVTSTKLCDLEIQLEKKLVSESIKEEDVKINKVLILYKKMKSFYNIEANEIQLIEDKIELISSVLFIIKSYPNVNEEKICNYLITWNKRKEEKYNFEDVKKSLKFLSSENVIICDLFGNFISNNY